MDDLQLYQAGLDSENQQGDALRHSSVQTTKNKDELNKNPQQQQIETHIH